MGDEAPAGGAAPVLGAVGDPRAVPRDAHNGGRGAHARDTRGAGERHHERASGGGARRVRSSAHGVVRQAQGVLRV